MEYVAIVIGIALMVVGAIRMRPLPAEFRTHTFAATLKAGELEASIYYQVSPNPFEPSVERITRRWAIELTDPVESKDLYIQLESELRRHLADFYPEVRKLTLKIPPPKVNEPDKPKLSPAQLMLAKQQEKRDCAIALAKDAGLELDIAPIVKQDAESTIETLYHHPDRA